jgi:hypothetical protein
MSTSFFDRLWSDYIAQNPHAKRVYDLLINEGETILNDHIAFRTFDHPSINIDVMAKPLLAMGYVEGQEYIFEEKKLFAKHYHHPSGNLPRVFISQLETRFFSPFLQNLVKELAAQFPKSIVGSEAMLFAGNQWGKPSFATYEQLKSESDYAAWLYVNGFRANHFTVSVNALEKYNDILTLNAFIKANGFEMNSANGEVKGSPAELLEQSSTMAGKEVVKFAEGEYAIPSCYYEFAKRYPDAKGQLYDGFIAQSADKIFESTNG